MSITKKTVSESELILTTSLQKPIFQAIRNRVTYSQREGAPPLGVDKEQSRDREDDLDGTVAEGRVQSLSGGVSDVGEDGGAVERNDVDTTQLKDRRR